MSDFVTVARVGDIPQGQGRAFEVHERIVAVFHRGDDYFAIDDMCPHMGASLASGHFNAQDCTVTCPWHGWRFDTREGTWCDNRKLKIDVFRVRVQGDEIQVALESDVHDNSE
jgi:nitrite reductase (NADH) small subunit/3-phenylpropionate/trans-cinnamate dioxygenase ferredoxin subunit